MNNGTLNINLTSELRELKLKIDGMTCESCAEAIRESLLQIKGVVSAKVSFAKGEPIVIYDLALTSLQEIIGMSLSHIPPH
jgi:copper chaperone CopZ